MSQTVARQVTPIGRTIECSHCLVPYLPGEACICECAGDHRTLVCPSCSRCSCSGTPAEVRAHYRNASGEEIQRLREERGRQPRLQPVSESLPRPLVVVADDNFDIRGIVKRQLEGLGYGVIAVENGEEAWNAVQRFRPEIALLDGLMPKGDGREISRRIKEDPTLHTKTVIMTSLYTSATQKAEAFREFRVDAYLTKPVKRSLLEETIKSVLDSSSGADRAAHPRH